MRHRIRITIGLLIVSASHAWAAQTSQPAPIALECIGESTLEGWEDGQTKPNSNWGVRRFYLVDVENRRLAHYPAPDGRLTDFCSKKPDAKCDIEIDRYWLRAVSNEKERISSITIDRFTGLFELREMASELVIRVGRGRCSRIPVPEGNIDPLF